MIILMGQTHDDVLYYENVLRNKKKEPSLYRRFPIITGSIFNQEVCLVYNVATSYLTGIVATALIEKYNPIAIIMFGKCKAISDNIKNGDIAISKRIIPVDVDQCEYFDVKLGQIPYSPEKFIVNTELVDLLSKSFDSIDVSNYHICSFISSNTIYSSKEDLEKYGIKNAILGVYDKFVLDSDCISPFLICNMRLIPFISIKIVDSKIGETSNVDNFVKTLASYGKVGKGMTTFIGEIGRRDLVS